MKLLLIALLMLLIYSNVSAQKEDEVITGKAAQDILNRLPYDSTVFLKNASVRACACIDSVEHSQSDDNNKLDAFARCIDEEVMSYQLMIKVMQSMKSNGTKNEIVLNQDKKSFEYRKYYFQIERWLKDSCKVLTTAIASNDVANDKSYSADPEAMKAYDQGVRFLREEKYEDGIPWFEKAVKMDKEFVFAWDNLGICYRRTGKLEKAMAAYQASLNIDPSGKTALQNLPVVFMMQHKNEEAIEAYKNILKHYPNDPEVYYGIAIVYYENLKELEKSLDNMCKAYNIYSTQKSPYRTDAEKVINMIFSQMKKNGKEDEFKKILSDNNITIN